MKMRSGPKVSGRSRRVAADQGWSLRGVPLYIQQKIANLCTLGFQSNYPWGGGGGGGFLANKTKLNVMMLTDMLDKVADELIKFLVKNHLQPWPEDLKLQLDLALSCLQSELQFLDSNHFARKHQKDCLRGSICRSELT